MSDKFFTPDGRPPMTTPTWWSTVTILLILVAAVYFKGPEVLRKMRERHAGQSDRSTSSQTQSAPVVR